jgi:hypothetical protein
MQEPIISAKAPGGRRRAKFLAVSVALTMATFGSVAAVTAGTASASFSPVDTQTYTISGASAAITSMTASVYPVTASLLATYTLRFVTPVALTIGGSSPSSIDIVEPATTPVLGFSTVTAVSVGDASTAFAYTATSTFAGSTLTAPLAASSGSINAGDTVTVTFTATNPAVTTVQGNTSYSVGLYTSASPTEETASITIDPAVQGAAVTASSQALGNGSTYTMTNVTGLTMGGGTIKLQACDTTVVAACPNLATPANGGTGNVTFSQVSTSYTVEDATTSTYLTVGAPVSLATNFIGGVGIPVTVPAGDTVLPTDDITITAVGQNPAAPESDDFVASIASSFTVASCATTSGSKAVTTTASFTGVLAGMAVTGTGIAASTTVAAVVSATSLTLSANATATGTATLTFAPATSPVLSITAAEAFGGEVTSVTVAPASSATGASTSWTVGFSVSTTGKNLTKITLEALNGAEFSDAGAVISDSTTGASQVIASGNAVAEALSTTKTTDDTVALTTTLTVNDSDAISVTIFGVTNPATGSYSGSNGLEVTTSTDVIPAYNGTPFVIGPVVVSSTSPSVTVSPATPGSLAVYTVGTFKAADALVGGTDTLEVAAEGELGATEFPGTATLTDATTATGTQTLTATSGAGTATVVYKLVNNVAAGDSLTLTMTSVVNPAGTPSGSTYYLELGADTLSNADAAGTQGLAAPGIPFPDAVTSYPDAAIVSFGGSDYVFAGLHAFAATASELTAVQAVDNATVVTAATGVAAPTTAAATGTVIIVAGSPTIYVVGTDGQLHGFATPAQFLGDGYDPADVITVPATGGLTVGATVGSVGAGANALATSANGAIVDSSGTFYVFAGGKAFGIPTLASLAAVQAGDTATPLTGTIGTAQTGATIRPGTLVTLHSAVYVANSNTNLVEFKSMAQLDADGYSGTPSIVVPNAGGLGVVTTYIGS